MEKRDQLVTDWIGNMSHENNDNSQSTGQYNILTKRYLRCMYSYTYDKY